MIPPHLLRPQIISSNDSALAQGEHIWRFLIDGDSWLANEQLFSQLHFDTPAYAVSTKPAEPRQRYLFEIQSDITLRSLVYGQDARPWNAWFMSLGLDDLLKAVQVAPTGRAARNKNLRLLLKPDEWGDPSLGARRYLSDAGWQTFAHYVRANLNELIRIRDDPASLCLRVPIFLHTYGLPTPRHAAASYHEGPWFYPAVKAYAIPITDWLGVAALLMQQLACLLTSLANDTLLYPELYVFDSLNKCAFETAALGERGISGDWADEVHLTSIGYSKLTSAWRPEIEKILQQKNPA